MEDLETADCTARRCLRIVRCNIVNYVGDQRRLKGSKILCDEEEEEKANLEVARIEGLKLVVLPSSHDNFLNKN